MKKEHAIVKHTQSWFDWPQLFSTLLSKYVTSAVIRRKRGGRGRGGRERDGGGGSERRDEGGKGMGGRGRRGRVEGERMGREKREEVRERSIGG